MSCGGWKTERRPGLATGKYCWQCLRRQSESDRQCGPSEYQGFRFHHRRIRSNPRRARSLCDGHSLMTAKAYDVVIIGAGIVGSACAAECAREGLSVAIVEAGNGGGGATAAGMGHLVVIDDSEAQFALTRYSQQLWDEIGDELPREVEHDSCGTIWIAVDDEEMAEVRRKAKFYSERGVPVEILDAHSLAEAEPNLRPGLVGGLRVPGDSVIYPPCAAQYFVDQATSKGASLFLGVAVESITAEGVLLGDGTSISAGVVVNSAGSSSPLLTRGLEVK